MSIVTAWVSMNINQIDLHWHFQNYRATYFGNNTYENHYGNVYQRHLGRLGFFGASRRYL